MFIRRDAARRVWSKAKRFPVMTLICPRYAGKTALVKLLFPRHEYVDLDNPDTLALARDKPEAFLKGRSGRLVIDEFRNAPELLEHLRAAASRVSQPGEMILVTSQLAPKPFFGPRQIREIPASTQLIMPLSIAELTRAKIDLSRDEYIHRGFMPRTHGEKIAPFMTYLNNLSHLINHDVKHLINLNGAKGRAAFGRFLRLLAGHIGQVITPEALARRAHVSVKTLAAWLSVLEANFVIFKLPMYFKRYGLEVFTNAPKIYFTDVGMVAYLLRIKTTDQVFRDPMVGNLFENMVVAEAFKERCNIGLHNGLYYFRDHNTIEVDLVIEKEQGITPVEIKCRDNFDSSYAKNIRAFGKLSQYIKEGCVIYNGETKTPSGKTAFLNFKEIGKVVGQFV